MNLPPLAIKTQEPCFSWILTWLEVRTLEWAFDADVGKPRCAKRAKCGDVFRLPQVGTCHPSEGHTDTDGFVARVTESWYIWASLILHQSHVQKKSRKGRHLVSIFTKNLQPSNFISHRSCGQIWDFDSQGLANVTWSFAVLGFKCQGPRVKSGGSSPSSPPWWVWTQWLRSQALRCDPKGSQSKDGSRGFWSSGVTPPSRGRFTANS